ncbi:MAG: hypothetical protein CME70_01725 [Halobacteriovorax sp.]|nr:hypothetical protein [Halobacteriovorax sp.]|tara:strand:+ start:7939 stop:9243 length:1305 start_codon:yes stop_codon:yes gene_type:complete
MRRSLCALIIFLICLGQSFAATVRINSASAPVITLINTSTFSLVVDSPSGDGTSEVAPAKTYVPVKSDNGTTNSQNYSTFGTTAVNLPTAVAVGSAMTGTLRFTLDLASVGAGEFLHAAIKDSGSTAYKVLTSTSVTVDQVGKTFDITLASMCGASAADLDCANLLSNSSPSTTQDALVYFYIATGPDGNGNTIDPASRTGGVYYEVNLSNRVYNNTITLSDLAKGDARLTASYQGFNFEELNSIVAFDFGANACQTLFSNTISQGTAYATDSTVSSGEAAIKPLVNDRAYKFAIYFEDKFKFASLISNCLSATPQQIEALLKKNSCFLLTAGFNGDHQIIDYFRSFRDEVLSRTKFGQAFIRWYYKWGPKLAPYVLENPWLAKSVRGGARLTFWVIHNPLRGLFLVFSMGLLLATMTFFMIRKKESYSHGRSQ